MAFHATVPVRFGDIDQAHIVYYPRFFHYYHVAFEEFFRDAVRIPYDVALGEDKIGFPTVHMETDFRKPLKYGDFLDIALSVISIGERSLTVRYRAYNKATGVLCAEAKITSACVNMDTFRATPLPQKYREVFERHLETPPAA